MSAWKRILRDITVTVAAFLVGALFMGWLIEAVLVGDPTPVKSAVFVGASLLGVISIAAAFKFVGHPDLAVAAAAVALLGFLMGFDSALGAIPLAAAVGTYGLLTRKRRARIAKLRDRQREVRVARREREWAEWVAEDAADALRAEARKSVKNVSTGWLRDALGASEVTRRSELVESLTPEVGYGLARLHRRGVPVEFIGTFWMPGEPMDDAKADAITTEYRASVGTVTASRPSVELERHAAAIVELGATFGITDIRVFGSCADGTDDADSDINLIGAVAPASGHFEIGAFTGRVEEMTGYSVDFVIDDAERPAFIAEDKLVLL